MIEKKESNERQEKEQDNKRNRQKCQGKKGEEVDGCTNEGQGKQRQ